VSVRTFPTLSCAGLLATLLVACGEDSRPRRPDVVLIVVDTLRNDHLSAYGYPRPTSPHLEQLAREGALFTDVTTQFSWTMPSMVSIMSGRYLTDFVPVLRKGVPTLAETFHAAGYRTLAVVSNILIDPKAGFDRGFDQYDVRPAKTPGHAGEKVPRNLEELAQDAWPQIDEALRPGADGARPPLFLYLHTFDPHHPYLPHPSYDAELPCDGAVPVEPPGWQARALAEDGPEAPDGGDWSKELGELAIQRGFYDQEVRYTDEQLRSVLDGLRARGVLDHAIVAFAADHGEGLWEHIPPKSKAELANSVPSQFFYQAHGAIQYQEVLRTPFVLWGAGVPKGARVEAPVENVDLFPTLLELADVPALGPLHGKSVVGLMGGNAGEWRKFVFSYAVHANSVREPATGLKLVMPRGKAELAGWPVQLFDLREDPHERANLAGQRPEDVKRLTAAFESWKAAYPTERFTESDHDAADRQGALKQLGYTEFDTGLHGGKQ
jgi:arylsulfatase A-like enzyme